MRLQAVARDPEDRRIARLKFGHMVAKVLPLQGAARRVVPRIKIQDQIPALKIRQFDGLATRGRALKRRDLLADTDFAHV